MDIIIGNIFSLIFAILLAISVIYEKKKDVLKWQLGAVLFGMLSNIVLASYAAVASNIIAFWNNRLCYKDKLTLKKAVFVCCLFIVIGLCANNREFIGILPILAEIFLVIAMYISCNSQHLRYGLVLNLPLWFIHDICIQAYPSAVIDIALTIWTLFQIFRYRRLGHE